MACGGLPEMGRKAEGRRSNGNVTYWSAGILPAWVAIEMRTPRFFGSSVFGALGPPMNAWPNDDNSSLYMGDQSGLSFQPDATAARDSSSDPPLGERTKIPSSGVPSLR